MPTISPLPADTVIAVTCHPSDLADLRRVLNIGDATPLDANEILDAFRALKPPADAWMKRRGEVMAANQAAAADAGPLVASARQASAMSFASLPLAGHVNIDFAPRQFGELVALLGIDTNGVYIPKIDGELLLRRAKELAAAASSWIAHLAGRTDDQAAALSLSIELEQTNPMIRHAQKLADAAKPKPLALSNAPAPSSGNAMIDWAQQQAAAANPMIADAMRRRQAAGFSK
jgi:hypothetical protein